MATYIPPKKIAFREDSFTTFVHSPQENALFCLLHNGFLLRVDCTNFTSEYIFLDYDYLNLRQFLAYKSIYIDGCAYYFAYNEMKYLCFDTKKNSIIVQDYQTIRNVGAADRSLIMDVHCFDGGIYCFSKSGEVLKIDISLKTATSIMDLGIPTGDGDSCYFNGEEYIFFENSDHVKIFDFVSNTIREQELGFQIDSLQSVYADDEFIYLLSKNGTVKKLTQEGLDDEFDLDDECSMIVAVAGIIWALPKLADNIYYIQNGIVRLYEGYNNDFCYVAPNSWLSKAWKYVNFVETERFIIFPMRIGNMLLLLSKDNGELYWQAIQKPSPSEELRMRYMVNDTYIIEGKRFDLNSFISSL